MHYTGTVWRPPFEFRSLLLQVTTGCSHNGCSFCSMYRKTPFHVSPMEEVRADLEEAARRFPETERVFLLSGDAFVLPAGRLPETRYVRGSMFCDLGLVVDPRTGRLIIVSAIDNICRGASGQALANANLMCGLPVEEGLDAAPLLP